MDGIDADRAYINLITTLDGTEPCADDPELWFPHDSGSRAAEPAKRICKGCPFRLPCLEYAVTHAVDGVWGATSVRDREQLRATFGIRPRRLLVSDYVTARAATDEEEAS